VVGVVGGIILGQAVDLLLSRLGVSQPQLPDLDARHDADAGRDGTDTPGADTPGAGTDA